MAISARPGGIVLSAALVACAFGLAAPSALADGNVTMLWDASADGVDPVEYDMDTEADQSWTDEAGLLHHLGYIAGQAEAWEIDYHIKTLSNSGGAAGGTDGTALVTADLAITNLTAQRQYFFALVTVNLDAPIIGGTFKDGTVSATVLDLFGSGAADITTIQSGPFASDPVYAAYIDGTTGGPVRTMWNDPFQLAYAGAPGGTAVDADTFASEPGPDANTSISVWLKVELSPFDQANLIGTFSVSAVPAPGAVSLLAMAGVAGFGRRRRRG